MIEDKLDKEENSVVHFFYNDNFLLLTHPKLAHTWCKRNINGDFYLDTSYMLNFFTLDISENPLAKNPISKEHFLSTKYIWNNFLEKKEERDLIILYRNPFDHFLSGFIQDFLKGIISINFHHFLNKIKISNKEKHEFLKDFYTSDQKINKITFEKHKVVWEHIAQFLFDYYIDSGKLIEGHYTPWMTFINMLLNHKKIDESKIKLIDIYDSPLEIQLKDYIPNNKLLKVNTKVFDKETQVFDKETRGNFVYFDVIKKIINNNEKYKNLIYSLLKYEMIYYKNFKNNKLIKQ